LAFKIDARKCSHKRAGGSWKTPGARGVNAEKS